VFQSFYMVWVRMGAWDLEPQDDRLLRKPYQPMLDALRDAHVSRSIG
jgi:hypothetical protein